MRLGIYFGLKLVYFYENLEKERMQVLHYLRNNTLLFGTTARLGPRPPI